MLQKYLEYLSNRFDDIIVERNTKEIHFISLAGLITTFHYKYENNKLYIKVNDKFLIDKSFERFKKELNNAENNN